MRLRPEWERSKAAILRHALTGAAWLAPIGTNLTDFWAKPSQIKENPETNVPGLKKPEMKNQTYFVTFGVRAAIFASKGL
jgi:hypothetical protein